MSEELARIDTVDQGYGGSKAQKRRAKSEKKEGMRKWGNQIRGGRLRDRRVRAGDVDFFRRGGAVLYGEIYGASANRTCSVHHAPWNRDHLFHAEYNFVIFEFNSKLPFQHEKSFIRIGVPVPEIRLGHYAHTYDVIIHGREDFVEVGAAHPFQRIF